jgi:hypothetical protein
MTAFAKATAVRRSFMRRRKLTRARRKYFPNFLVVAVVVLAFVGVNTSELREVRD